MTEQRQGETAEPRERKADKKARKEKKTKHKEKDKDKQKHKKSKKRKYDTPGREEVKDTSDKRRKHSPHPDTGQASEDPAARNAEALTSSGAFSE